MIELQIGRSYQKLQLTKKAVTDKAILGSELELEGAKGSQVMNIVRVTPEHHLEK